MRIITRNIIIISFVSLFTDMASEMLYPIMPLFLKFAGYSVIFIGILEGFAEAVAGLSKSYFGKMSDISGKRLPFVSLGYALSAISKPMLAIFTLPWWIFLSRFTDRMGKGIRTGARDALLSDESQSETKGQVFGFHRAMDTTGALLGPVAAIIYLYFFPNDFKTLFLIAFIPGIIASLLTLTIKEKKKEKSGSFSKTNLFPFLQYWKQSPGDYRKLVTGLLIFAIFNSSDVFLLLKIRESGASDTVIIGIYIFYNLVYAAVAYPAGKIADKIGMKKVFLTGLFLFAIVYFGFAINNNIYVYLILFAIYGIYAAATESVAKAWISNMVNKRDTATAIGSYSGFQSIAAFAASSLCGVLWYNFGATTTFTITSLATVVVIIYLANIRFISKKNIN